MRGSDAARVSLVLRIFMYYDAVKMSLCTETLWKCHYTVWCFAKRSERPCISLATVVFTFAYEGFWHCKSVTWASLVLRIFMYCDAVKVSLCTETLWKCHYTVWCFAKRSERPCISLELSYSHSCMKGSDTARVSLVLIRGFFVLRRCESVFMYWDAVKVSHSLVFRKALRASLH